MNKDQLPPYLHFAEPYYAGKDPAHNFQHIQRIVGRLDWLSQGLEPPPQPHKLYFLACFHGLGKLIQSDAPLQEQIHTFLIDLGWDSAEATAIFYSLYRHLTGPQTVEERIVHDANFVETLGAFGIAKAFTTGGARGQSIADTLHIFEHQVLNQVEFHTPAGKRFAQKMRPYTKAFLQQLKAELN